MTSKDNFNIHSMEFRQIVAIGFCDCCLVPLMYWMFEPPDLSQPSAFLFFSGFIVGRIGIALGAFLWLLLALDYQKCKVIFERRPEKWIIIRYLLLPFLILLFWESFLFYIGFTVLIALSCTCFIDAVLCNKTYYNLQNS